MEKDLIFKQFSDVKKTRDLLHASTNKIDRIDNFLSKKIENNETQSTTQ
jgi:hypothetical protein